MNTIGEKLLGMDIESAINEMYNNPYNVCSLPSDVKSELLQQIESLSEDEIEELDAEEVIENLKEVDSDDEW